jgi:hypothetical protein
LSWQKNTVSRATAAAADDCAISNRVEVGSLNGKYAAASAALLGAMAKGLSDLHIFVLF